MKKIYNTKYGVFYTINDYQDEPKDDYILVLIGVLIGLGFGLLMILILV